MEDVQNDTKLHLEHGDFCCADGIIPTQTTKKAIIEFRFPRSYGLGVSDIHPFVASYVSGIDYEVESEIERMQIKMESYAGNLLVRRD